MHRTCSACGGSGFEEHIDRTLPPPPCRLCHPLEARQHLALARDTRHVAGGRRISAYYVLRDALGSATALSA